MDTVYYRGKNLKYQQFSQEVSFLVHRFLVVLVGNGDTRKLTVGLDQVHFFLKEAFHKFDSWPRILELEGNSMLSQANKHLGWHYWKWIQHSSCGVVTIA